MLKAIALMGLSTLKKNLDLSIDTVERIDGKYLHIEVSVFDRVLVNEYFKLLDKDQGKMEQDPIDVNYTGAEKIRRSAINKMRTKL